MTVTCPQCRDETPLVEGRAGSLEPAFNINSLREAFDKLQVENETDDGTTETTTTLVPVESPISCRKHRSQSLDLHCQDCDVLVCRDCLLDSTDHFGHKYTYVSKLGTERRLELVAQVSEFARFGERIAAKMDEISQLKATVNQHEASTVQATLDAFATLSDVLESAKRNVLSLLHEAMQNKRETLNSQEQVLQELHHKLQCEVEELNTVVATYSNQQLFLTWPHTKETIHNLTESLQLLPSCPLGRADIIAGINTITPEALQVACEQALKFLYVVDISKTKISGDGLHFAQTFKDARFHIKLYDMHDDPYVLLQQGCLTAELKSLRNDLITSATIIQVDPSQYTGTYTVKTCGRYELSICLDRQHVPNSPLPIYVTKPPHHIWVRIAEISTLQQPTGLAIVGERVYVAEHGGNRVTIFNSKLEKLHSIEGLVAPSEITVDEELNLYVCTVGDHQLRKLGADDSLKKIIGGEGNGKYNFQFPNGNCFHHRKLYVCDSENNRIKVYDSDLNLLKVYGKKGKRAGEFDFPCDIDIDSNEMIYVVDGHNHRLQVFNSNWEHQRIIGKRGTCPGELLQPVSVCISNRQIFITEYANNRISVFSVLGQFLATFGERYLKEPEGLAIDQDGFVYVSHSRKNVLVFC